MASRDDLLNQPRSGARPLGGSPGPSRPASGRPPNRPPAMTTRTVPARTGRSGGSTGSSSSSGGGSRGGTPSPAPVSAGPATRPGRPKGSGLSTARSAARTGRQFSSPEFSNYQGIILAEFVLAELLVAATPIATRKPSTGADKLSPYVPRDMTKMLSIGLLYFLLELMAVGNARWGRVGAWFGGLILITVGLNEAANVAKILNLFGQGSSGSLQKEVAKGQVSVT